MGSEEADSFYHLQLTYCREVNKVAAGHALSPHVLWTMTLQGCVAADITYTTVHAHHELLARSRTVSCGVLVWASSWKPWLLLHRGSTEATSWLCYMKLCRGSLMVMLWLLCQPGENKCVFSSLWVLVSASSLLAHALPTLGSGNSADSVNSETVGAVSRISWTHVLYIIYLNGNTNNKKFSQRVKGRTKYMTVMLFLMNPWKLNI